jgi:hypothetical protein
MPFQCVVRSATMFFLLWSNTCRYWLSDLLSMSLFFSSFLSPHLKIIVWSSLLLIFQFQSLFFLFIFFSFDPFVKVLFVFNFILRSQFTKNIFFNLILILLIFFLNPFIKVLVVFNFILQSKLMVLCFSI